MKALPELLTMIAKDPSADDPRGMEQRYLSNSVFRVMLKRFDLKSVDKDLLVEAVAAGLQNQDGRARSNIGSIYSNLSTEEIKLLLPAILKSVVEPAPSGIMYADEIRIEGLRVLSNNHIEEGIQPCADYILGQNPWASEKRTPEILKILLTYGSHAKAAIPTLERAAIFFEVDEKDLPKTLSLRKAADIREAIRTIKASNDRPKLIRLN